MREIKIAKRRLYLLVFTTLWSFGIATEFVLTRHAAGREVWATVIRNAVFSVVVTTILYFMRKDEK